MHHTTSRAGLVRAGLTAAALSIGGALVAYASLPPASNDGQARAEAGAANGQAANSHRSDGQADHHPDENAGQGTTTAGDRLAENQDRLVSTLSDVMDRLTANDKVPDAAVNALQNVIDRLGGDIGLNRAMEAVGGSADHPDHPNLPDAATDHPGKP